MLPHQFRDEAPHQLRSSYGMKMMPLSLGNIILLKEENERVTGRKARGLQMEEIGCKCQTFFLSLLSSRRKQIMCQSFGFPDSSVGKESPCNAGDPGLIPGLGRFPGEGIGYPLQYSWASLIAQLVKNMPAMWET